MKQQHATVQEPAPQQLCQPQFKLLLTLLFLNAVGLQRPWDLRDYTGSELGLLTGRPQPYSYRHVERGSRGDWLAPMLMKPSPQPWHGGRARYGR